MLQKDEHFFPDSEEVCGSLLHAEEHFSEAIHALRFRECCDNVHASHDLGIIPAGESLPGQLERHFSPRTHRVDMGLDSLLQIGHFRPGNLGIAYVPAALSEEEFNLGEVLFLELTNEPQEAWVLAKGGEFFHDSGAHPSEEGQCNFLYYRIECVGGSDMFHGF
jgi:hypothetical protein